jgi:hypothetical protein
MSAEGGHVTPTGQWEWDAEFCEVVALDVNATRGGDSVPVDFTDKPVGVLAAAAPEMARALLEVRDAIITGTMSEDAPEVIERVLRKAGVIP